MIKHNDIVTLHYTVATQDGVTLDSSRDGEPMKVMIGSRFLIDGLENALIGKSKGEQFTISVPPEQAYGIRQEMLVQTVPISMFEGIEVEPGMSFRATTDDGEQSVMVVEVDNDGVIVDGNHPLAGIPLTFEVDILDTREPTEVELSEGKPCKPDCGCC